MDELTLLDCFRLALIEGYACPECLAKLDRDRGCTNPRCGYHASVEWETGGRVRAEAGGET